MPGRPGLPPWAALADTVGVGRGLCVVGWLAFQATVGFTECVSRWTMEAELKTGVRMTMPLSGEAIRMMNYVDDVSTTMRRLLATAPLLTVDERKRVSEYLKVSTPNANEVLAILEKSTPLELK